MSTLAAVVSLIAMGLCLLVVPLGLPGVWLMLAVLAVGTFLGEVGPWLFVVLVALAGLAELAEFLLVKRLSARYGGSNRAFWGAILGGLVGAVVGTPLPLVGSLVGVFLGSFAGAVAVALWETRRLRDSARVGWGAVLGRAGAAAFKTAVGLAILIAGGVALLG